MGLNFLEIPIKKIRWKNCWRIIPTRFPSINPYEKVSSQADLSKLHQIEGMTNQRLRQERGQIHLVPPKDVVTGPGSSYIMAAFTHLNPDGSRFSNGTWGIYYAAHTMETAIQETIYHKTQGFMSATDETSTDLDMLVLTANLNASLHDIRKMQTNLPEIYSKKNYAAGQILGRTLKENNSWGIAYNSVRHRGGENIAIFRPPALSHCCPMKHLTYHWDGTKISVFYEKKLLS